MDFNNERGANLGDPKFDKDGVNLRTMKSSIATSISGQTVNINSIQFIPMTVPVTPNNGLMFYSGNTLYIFTGNTSADLRVL